MFTPTVLTTNKEEGLAKVVVSFSNGTLTVEKEFVADSVENLKSQVRAEKNRLEAVDALSVAGGVLDVSTTPDTPTQAEIDFKTWRDAYYQMVKDKELIANGVLTGNETAVANLRSAVIAGYKAPYRLQKF